MFVPTLRGDGEGVSLDRASHGDQERGQSDPNVDARLALTREWVLHRSFVHRDAVRRLDGNETDVAIEGHHEPSQDLVITTSVVPGGKRLGDQESVDVHHQRAGHLVRAQDLRGPLGQHEDRLDLVIGDQERIGLAGHGSARVLEESLEFLEQELTGVRGLIGSTSSRHSFS